MVKSNVIFPHIRGVHWLFVCVKMSICIEYKFLACLPSLQVNDWELLFSNAVNGNSLQTMTRLCAGKGATVVAVEDVNGNVFGE